MDRNGLDPANYAAYVSPHSRKIDGITSHESGPSDTEDEENKGHEEDEKDDYTEEDEDGDEDEDKLESASDTEDETERENKWNSTEADGKS